MHNIPSGLVLNHKEFRMSHFATQRKIQNARNKKNRWEWWAKKGLFMNTYEDAAADFEAGYLEMIEKLKQVYLNASLEEEKQRDIITKKIKPGMSDEDIAKLVATHDVEYRAACNSLSQTRKQYETILSKYYTLVRQQQSSIVKGIVEELNVDTNDAITAGKDGKTWDALRDDEDELQDELEIQQEGLSELHSAAKGKTTVDNSADSVSYDNPLFQLIKSHSETMATQDNLLLEAKLAQQQSEWELVKKNGGEVEKAQVQELVAGNNANSQLKKQEFDMQEFVELEDDDQGFAAISSNPVRSNRSPVEQIEIE